MQTGHDPGQTVLHPDAPSPSGAPVAAPIEGRRGGVAPMNITCFLFSTMIGGPQICTAGIHARLIERGHRAEVVIPDGEGSGREFFASRGIPVKQLSIPRVTSPKNVRGLLSYMLRFPAGVLEVRAHLRRTGTDVVRVNGALDLVPLIGSWLAGVPVVLYLNDTAFPRSLSTSLARIGARFATRIVAAATRVGAHHGLDMSGTQVIYEPVDTVRFLPRDPDEFPSKTPMLGLIANWNPIKCQERFIEVVRALHAQGVQVSARILGSFPAPREGYWRPLLDEMERTGLSRFIDCPGFVDDPRPALNEFDLLLLTSRSEACPVCVLEAMSVGVPVVSFDVGGVREMLGADSGDPAGVVIPQGDCAQMAEAVRNLLANPDLHRAMARSGQRRARTIFSLDDCARQHEALYADLVGTGRRRSPRRPAERPSS